MNNYRVQIESHGRAVANKMIDSYTYVPMQHEGEYKIRLFNLTSNRCNVVLSIDGKNMGKWRIGENSSIVLERPSASARKFTFVRETSWQASMGGIRQGESSNGLIEVKFIPEQEMFYGDSETNHWLGLGSSSNLQSCIRGVCQPNSDKQFSSGGTVLGRQSDQRFGQASHMIEDTSRSVIKKLRLIVDNEQMRHETEYVPIDHRDATPPRIESRFSSWLGKIF